MVDFGKSRERLLKLGEWWTMRLRKGNGVRWGGGRGWGMARGHTILLEVGFSGNGEPPHTHPTEVLEAKRENQAGF